MQHNTSRHVTADAGGVAGADAPEAGGAKAGGQEVQRPAGLHAGPRLPHGACVIVVRDLRTRERAKIRHQYGQRQLVGFVLCCGRRSLLVS